MILLGAHDLDRLQEMNAVAVNALEAFSHPDYNSKFNFVDKFQVLVSFFFIFTTVDVCFANNNRVLFFFNIIHLSWSIKI